MKKIQPEKLVLGIDPGTQVMGYGLIHVQGSKVSLVQYGVIHLKKFTTHALKLRKIHERITNILEEYAPDEMALEAPFVGQNIQSALKLGRAQGVAMSAALIRDIPITEYAPKKVKVAVTGNGNASKEQVASMLEKLLKFKMDDKTLLDATDALGVAVCHVFQKGDNTQKKQSWKNFLTDNPNRISKRLK
ncbi:crossover junction endodeoxyribonuclease RuvC [Flammeovirga kamogawensis]|uniref:Crossover junction endodeoxyribonuclease RuvC n=1 Tax=Flammeovirga kamogawensis TaxID=373891 RepID=A0ABX8GYI9_9BACT|nr:crossover junction endodeoxyribonuclease RuvC [Flammeovirga kamogawensis]MBB6462857.1 crossover junction endodeoxyribonuclease RuvC [Flammeovirga kamogawensis]QWG08361.1 crossover junction endodeoxyribonuclease RuvC [Flammeovirga kamogawensis]TRX66657.1 crossover junction endodeoxyribonuclease RuvC [Flammeovirga kamogawensis]